MPGDKFFYKKRNAKVQYTLRKTKKNAIFDLSSNICKNKNKNKCLSCNTIKFYLKTSMLSDVPVYCIFKIKVLEKVMQTTSARCHSFKFSFKSLLEKIVAELSCLELVIF